MFDGLQIMLAEPPTHSIATEIDKLLATKTRPTKSQLWLVYKKIVLKYPERNEFIDFHFQHRYNFRIGKSKCHIGGETIIWLLKVHAENCMFNLHKGLRIPNMPEGVSENIIRLIVNKANLLPGYHLVIAPDKGDLVDMKSDKRIEVKCYQSDGPVTFGPREDWDIIVFLGVLDNATRFVVSIVRAVMAQFKSLPVNAKETFGEQQAQGRRPRINPDSLKAFLATSFPNQLETREYTNVELTSLLCSS